MRPYTDQEWESLPHIVMTSDVDWDPALLDGEFPLTGQEPHLDTSTYHNGTQFDIHGAYTKGTLVASARRVHGDEDAALIIAPEPTHVAMAPEFLVLDDGMDDSDKHPRSLLPPPEPPPTVDTALTFTNVSPHLTPASLEPEQLRKFFAFLPTEVVARTLAATTQYARVPVHDVMRRFYRSPYPALNVARRNKDLLTNVVYSDTPAIDDGSTSASVYSGRRSHVLDVFGMKTDKQFVTTLEDVIRERGAPSRLLSDHALTIRSQRVVDILRALYIGAWTSEPHRQNQNTMERRYQTLKRITNLELQRDMTKSAYDGKTPNQSFSGKILSWESNGRRWNYPGSSRFCPPFVNLCQPGVEMSLRGHTIATSN
jgi:transposase InsO family protein